MFRFWDRGAMSLRGSVLFVLFLAGLGAMQIPSPARGADDQAAVNAILEHQLPSVHFSQTPFSDAIDFLRDLTGANIVVDDRAIKAAGIDVSQATVTLAEHDAKVSDVLKAVLDQTSNGKLGFVARDGIITITTVEAAKAAATQPAPPALVGDPHVLAKLATKLPSVQFRETPLPDAVDFLHDLTGVNIEVDWASLKSAGVGRDATVDFGAHNVALSAVLQEVLAKAGGEKLMYRVDGNVVDIVVSPDVAGAAKAVPDAVADQPATPLHDAAAAKGAERVLNEALPSVVFDKTPLTDALDSLGKSAGAEIEVRWSVLKGAGVDEKTPVTANLSNVPLSEALKSILDQAGDGKLTYTVDHGAIVVMNAGAK